MNYINIVSEGIVGNSETIHAFAIVDNGEDVLSFENVKVLMQIMKK